MEFIRLDVNEKIWYFGECKITVNTLSKQLIVETIDEDLKMMSASFDQKMYHQKNILFIFMAQKEIIDFILIFQRESQYEKVFQVVKKIKELETSEDYSMFSQKFLLPFSKSIRANEELKKHLKNDLTTLLKYSQTIEEPLPNQENVLEKIENVAVVEINDKQLEKNSSSSQLKRIRAESIENDENSEVDYNSDLEDIGSELDGSDSDRGTIKKSKTPDKSPSKNGQNQIITEENFKLVTFKIGRCSKKRLIIFPNANDKKYCYEFFYNTERDYYLCAACSIHKQRRTVFARLYHGEEDGEKDHVELRNQKHICEPKEYDSKKYEDDEKIFKPFYEIHNYQYRKAPSQRLVIFTDLAKEFCYEFTYVPRKKLWSCCKCCTNGLRYSVFVHKNGENGEDYLSFPKKSHICEPVKYCPEKYKIMDLKIVKKPYFQFVDRRYHGKITTKLVVFDENEKDRNLCHEYNLAKTLYFCTECQKKHKIYVTARIIKDENDCDNDHVELSRNQHQCELKEFIPSDMSQNIVKPPNFIIRTSNNEARTLVVNHPTNKNLCYSYSYNVNRRNFFCNACDRLEKGVTAKIIKDRDGIESVYLSPINEHICEDEFKEIELNSTQFKLETNEKTQKYPALIIFHPTNKNLYYDFYPIHGGISYKCRGCYNEGKHYCPAKLYKRDNGELYVTIGSKEHRCEPYKFKK